MLDNGWYANPLSPNNDQPHRNVAGYLGTSDISISFLLDAISCLNDLNDDDTIDTADLGILLDQFGSVGPDADINGDGVVDTADLGILLGAFGNGCP